jgi:hypothetical protein
MGGDISPTMMTMPRIMTKKIVAPMPMIYVDNEEGEVPLVVEFVWGKDRLLISSTK